MDLSAIRDPALVASAIAQSLGLPEREGSSPLKLLTAHLAEKHSLLILDNFEQILVAAPVLTSLLAHCSQLQMLVTSRALLNVRGEQEFSLSPLSLPDSHGTLEKEHLARIPSVALFVERAREHLPTFQLTEANKQAIADIAIQLEGLPLAIELAAARIRLLSPAALLTRLSSRLSLLTGGSRDLPERQQTMRQTIAWSYELLSAGEQRLFCLASLFAGSFTLNALEAISCMLGERKENVLAGLEHLLEKNLVRRLELRPEEVRFTMLETIREFAQEVLSVSGEWRKSMLAYAQYYVELAAEVRPKLDGNEQAGWFAFLESEIENLRAVLAWSLSRDGEREPGLRLACTLNIFWRVRGHLQEINQYFRLALDNCPEIPKELRASALDWAGSFALFCNDPRRAEVLNQQSLRLYRELGNHAGMADSLFILARIAGEVRGEYARARQMYEECLQLYQEGGDLLGCAEIRNELAWLAQLEGEYAVARLHAGESIALCREQDDTFDLVLALKRLTDIAFEQGNYQEARAFIKEAELLARDLKDKDLLVACLQRLGQIEVAEQGSQVNREQVEAWLAEAFSLVREADVPGKIGSVWLTRGQLALAQSRLEEGWDALERCCQAEQIADEWIVVLEARALLVHTALARGLSDQAIHCFEAMQSMMGARKTKRAEVQYLEALAHLATQDREAERAARLWGVAAARRSAGGFPLSAFERELFYDQALLQVRSLLSKPRFAAAWEEGQRWRSLSFENLLARMSASMSSRVTPARVRSKRDGEVPLSALVFGLTRRELDVLRELSKGLTNAQIAEQLVISVITVNSYVRSIYSKLGVTSRAAATRKAFEHQLL